MATRIAWLLNLDADLELADAAGYRASAIPHARLSELRTRIVDLIAPDDLVLDDDFLARARGHGVHDVHDLRELRVLSFCPTPSALSRIAALGLPPPAAPALAVLRAVNDRAFCARLGHGLSGSCFATDMDTLCRHILAAPEQRVRDQTRVLVRGP